VIASTHFILPLPIPIPISTSVRPSTAERHARAHQNPSRLPLCHSASRAQATNRAAIIIHLGLPPKLSPTASLRSIYYYRYTRLLRAHIPYAMETMHATYPSHPPLGQPSRMAESRPRPTFDQPTRNMHAADLQPQQLSAPASQESIITTNSYGSSVGSQLQSASSNASQLTSYTDPTSPSSYAPTTKTEHSTLTLNNDVDVRDRTPEDHISREGDAAFISPASTSTPVATNGTKRTAEGYTKETLGVSSTPFTGVIRGNRSRAASTASSSGSRAGELAANLKARLGYAMTKVQNGWEHKSFSEVERLTAQKVANRHSMSHLDYNRRPMSSGLANGTARLSMYEPHHVSSLDGGHSPPSKRSSGTYANFAPTRAPHTTGTTPRLQPAPDIRPANSYRSHPYPQQLHKPRHNNGMSPPRTPITHQARRPHPIRTDTQTAEAEREALQALFQLGSPHGSQIPRAQTTSRASSSQTSPLRAESSSTPRRVTFARSDSAGTSESADSIHESRQKALDNLENN
jgi:hypothetical protein